MSTSVPSGRMRIWVLYACWPLTVWRMARDVSQVLPPSVLRVKASADRFFTGCRTHVLYTNRPSCGSAVIVHLSGAKLGGSTSAGADQFSPPSTDLRIPV